MNQNPARKEAAISIVAKYFVILYSVSRKAYQDIHQITVGIH